MNHSLQIHLSNQMCLTNITCETWECREPLEFIFRIAFGCWLTFFHYWSIVAYMSSNSIESSYNIHLILCILLLRITIYLYINLLTTLSPSKINYSVEKHKHALIFHILFVWQSAWPCWQAKLWIFLPLAHSCWQVMGRWIVGVESSSKLPQNISTDFYRQLKCSFCLD